MVVGPGAAADLAAVVAGQGGVHGGGVGVVDAVVGGADEGAAVHLPGQARQQLAHLDAGDGGGDRLELAANLGRGVRLHVPHVEVAGAAVEEDEDAGVGLGAGPSREPLAGGQHAGQR